MGVIMNKPSISVPGPLNKAWQATQSLFATLALLDPVRTERKALARLDDRDHKDKGIDRATALNESTRGYFDAPRLRLKQSQD